MYKRQCISCRAISFINVFLLFSRGFCFFIGYCKIFYLSADIVFRLIPHTDGPVLPVILVVISRIDQIFNKIGILLIAGQNIFIKLVAVAEFAMRLADNGIGLVPNRCV